MDEKKERIEELIKEVIKPIPKLTPEVALEKIKSNMNIERELRKDLDGITEVLRTLRKQNEDFKKFLMGTQPELITKLPHEKSIKKERVILRPMETNVYATISAYKHKDFTKDEAVAKVIEHYGGTKEEVLEAMQELERLGVTGQVDSVYRLVGRIRRA